MKILNTLCLCLSSLVIYAQNVSIKSDTVCLGELTELVVTSDSTNVSFLWDIDFDGYYDDASGDTILYMFPEGNNEVKVKAVFLDGSATELQETHNISLNPIPSVDFAVVGNCAGELTKMFNHSNSTDSTSYIWNIYSDDNSIITTIENWDADYTFTADASYVIQLASVSENGCKNSVSKNHIVYPESNVSISHEDNVCKGETVTFAPQFEDETTISTLIWKFGDGKQVIANDEQLYTYAESGEYNISLISVSEMHCKDTVSTTVNVSDLPIVDFVYEPSEKIYEGNAFELTLEADFPNYLWSDSSDLESIQISASGTYSVTVTDDISCKSSDSISFEFLPKPVLSVKTEILTPNNDGFNDFFIVNDLDAFSDCSLRVMNADGQEIYTTSNYTNDWDGKVDGALLAAGVYFYEVSATNETETGSIQILH